MTIDEGNTITKLALFEGDDLVLKENNVSVERVLELASNCDRLIVSSVKKDSEYGALAEKKDVLVLNSTTPIPVSNCYKTPNTLGNDRIALVVGATVHYSGHNVLVIDAGTCITYDFINAEQEYLGGSISPGIRMRYSALHQYTSQLPMLKTEEKAALIGGDTEESIHSGVINGVLAEIDGVIQRYIEQYPDVKVVVTGGNVKLFDKGLKNTIFASPNLLMEGLNKILDYNESYF
ncbi:MAG: pantothenate kinase [Flavobacteriales bacterium]|nr:pantothenate kinase [Flavobacteriales bacterium]